ncbi:regulator [Streptomyces sp. AcH 505]|nr:regulator [Streptomyces sp. AcH 505]
MERTALNSTRGAAAASQSPKGGIAFDGEPGMIAEARHFTADFLAQVRTGYGEALSARLIGTAQLVVSELVTNARKYAVGPCLLDLELADDMVEITVWDSNSTLPLARAADPGRVGQHGMEIILSLCDGFDVRRELVGKRITVRLAVAA